MTDHPSLVQTLRLAHEQLDELATMEAEEVQEAKAAFVALVRDGARAFSNGGPLGSRMMQEAKTVDGLIPRVVLSQIKVASVSIDDFDRLNSPVHAVCTVVARSDDKARETLLHAAVGGDPMLNDAEQVVWAVPLQKWLGGMKHKLSVEAYLALPAEKRIPTFREYIAQKGHGGTGDE